MPMTEKTSLVSPSARVSIDVYGLNPIAEDYRQVNAANYQVSTAKAGAPPKMFASGTADLPAFTASGIDPQLLLRLPYTARHYVAALPDTAAALAIFEDDATNPDLTLGHRGLQDAIARVRNWAAGRADLQVTE